MSTLKIATGIKQCNKGLAFFEDASLLVAIALMLGLSLLQIILRNGFDSGLVWAETALRVLVLWSALLGALRASRTGGHIAIDILNRYAKGAFALYSEVFVLVFSAIICLYAAWWGLAFIMMEIEDASIAFLGIPVWVCEAIIPFTLAMLGIRFAFEALEKLFIRD